MEIIVKLHPDVALEFQSRRLQSPVATELARVVEALGASLSPLHPGEVDPSLTPFYRLDVGNADAERALDALRASGAVDGAYVKPADEPP